MPILFIIFVIVPIIEIALFIQAGDWFGLGPTIMMIILTAVIGISLLRQQGLSILYKAQQKMNHGEMPALEMVEGIMLAIAGALLITPGFFTDTIGFLLLIPMLRQFLFTRVLQSKFQQSSFHQGNQSTDFNQSPFSSHPNEQPNETIERQNRTIDGEYKNTDED